MNKSFLANFKSILGAALPENFSIQEENKVLLQINPVQLHLQLHPISFQNRLLSPNPTLQKCIHIYEDQWLNQQEIVISRIKNVLGLSQKIAARACAIEKLSKQQAADFFARNHLLGACMAAYSFGLFYRGELCLAASFSKSRVMVDGAVYYRSYELIRFASLTNTVVVGGLHKILQHFIKEKNVVHLMTYIDLNFGDGKSFEKFGFKKIGSAQKQSFYLNPTTKTRLLKKDFEVQENPMFEPVLVEEFSTQKMILDLR